MNMQIHETSTPVWQELALNNPCISKIVFPATYARNARSDSILPTENSGYYFGVVRNDAFYVVGHHCLSTGKCRRIDKSEDRRVDLHPERHHAWVFAEERVRMFARYTDNVATVLMHNHPKMDQEILYSMCFDETSAYTSVLEEEMAEGFFDYLGKNGKKPSLDDVINEVLSRPLSPSDIEFTPGCAHVLLTDTFRLGSITSCINGYRIDPHLRATSKLPIELLCHQSASERNWYKKIMARERKTFLKVAKRHEKIERKLTLEQTLKPHLIPHDVFFIRT